MDRRIGYPTIVMPYAYTLCIDFFWSATAMAGDL